MLEIIHDAIRSRDHATMATHGIIFSLMDLGPNITLRGEKLNYKMVQMVAMDDF